MINFISWKNNLLLSLNDRKEKAEEFLKLPPILKEYFAESLLKVFKDRSSIEANFLAQIYDCTNTIKKVKDSQIISFSSEQAKIFSELIDSYTESLDYKLPFKNTLLKFDPPIPYRRNVYSTGTSGKITNLSSITALILSQDELTYDQYLEEAEATQKLFDGFDISIQPIINLKKFINNTVTIVFDTFHIFTTTWQSEITEENFIETLKYAELNEELIDDKVWSKNLAIACIGYINCENIYLEKEGEVTEKVNRKRESKGKTRIEPYYICRIKGVNYESNATGEGTKHSFRYDVRGHFRKMSTGKTMWIRPHQRGITNELYIPKTYKINKGDKG